MKIHGLCVIKNERDIIDQTLIAAAKWCDKIFVLDNGSNDGTWEIVQRLSREIDAIVPYMQDPRPFTDSIRNLLLQRFGNHAGSEDWWCILDADEFYIDNPQSFLRDVPKKYKAVWMHRYSYLFTDADLAAYKADPASFDDHTPIEKRIRYYVEGGYAELRFFRHIVGLKNVPGTDLYPICPRRIRIKHYAYRSPAQITTRLETRREPMQRGEFLHEKQGAWAPGGSIVPGPARQSDLPRSWMERIASHAECKFDQLDGTYAQAPAWTPPPLPNLMAQMKFSIRSIRRRIRWALRQNSIHRGIDSPCAAATNSTAARDDPLRRREPKATR